MSTEMKILAPLPGDTTKFIVPFGTIGQQGFNNLEVFVNPRVQPENIFDNNFVNLSSKLRVLGDSLPPVLAVTVDGREVARDEFVSATPLIQIKLWDNNPFLLKTDTTGMVVFLKRPCTDNCDFERVYLSFPEVVWSPETEESEFTIQYHPQLAEEGIYTLRVEAQDASGNTSGPEPYELSFQVAGESTVIFSAPFPNPFMTETNFQFVITGSVIPNEAQVDILNLAGKPIQQFSIDSESLHIGTNVMHWPGIDDKGNTLPNGIYIYRLKVKMQEEVFSTIGKVVLVR
jgi:hypothetical protein